MLEKQTAEQPGLASNLIRSNWPEGKTFISTLELAKATDTRVNWWEKLRLVGGGPRYTKLGRLVRYRVSDIEAWFSERTAESTSQYTAA